MCNFLTLIWDGVTKLFLIDLVKWSNYSSGGN